MSKAGGGGREARLIGDLWSSSSYVLIFLEQEQEKRGCCLGCRERRYAIIVGFCYGGNVWFVVNDVDPAVNGRKGRRGGGRG